MNRAKLVVAVACALLGIGGAIAQAFQGNWYAAAGIFVLGPSIGLGFLLGCEASRESLLLKGLFGLVTILGIASVFFEHRAFDMRRIDTHMGLLNAFIGMGSSCRIMSAELRELQKEGTMACALQGKSDQLDAIAELQKTRILTPTLGFIDSIRSAASEPDADWCAEVFRAAKPLCQDAFIGVPLESQQLLLKR